MSLHLLTVGRSLLRPVALLWSAWSRVNGAINMVLLRSEESHLTFERGSLGCAAFQAYAYGFAEYTDW